MSNPRNSMAAPAAKVVLDHVHTHGKQATHIRGTLIASSLSNLREEGLYERYVDLLPTRVRDQLLFAIASSWVPIEPALLHYQTIDALQLGPDVEQRLGARTAGRLSDTFLGTLLRSVRSMGVESLWAALRQNGRFWDRLYCGGRVCVLQLGPKEVIVENYGLPLVESTYWRSAYLGYMGALGGLFVKVAHLRYARPREVTSDSIAVAGSWV